MRVMCVVCVTCVICDACDACDVCDGYFTTIALLCFISMCLLYVFTFAHVCFVLCGAGHGVRILNCVRRALSLFSALWLQCFATHLNLDLFSLL